MAKLNFPSYLVLMITHDHSRTLLPSAVVRFQAACEQAGISPSTMRRLIHDGRGPRIIQLSERRIGVRRADLDEWLSSRFRK